ncbi:MAG: SAM-dependent methyltransferase [Bacteroidales bacterium]|jgi:16S rRNA (cytidine1402-2'-O)-methyltransferase|nr:SAM-dependent methyltransferase [Bacteroidales bacterium]
MESALYLFPTLLADVDYRESLPSYNVEKVMNCECFIVEQIRTARRFLRKIGYKKDFDKVVFYVLNEHTLDNEIDDFLTPLKQNKDIFLMSEAGLPCVADPGQKVVSLAQQKNYKIVPLVGPSSIYLSLMASGFNGQNFAFLGYLPVKDNEREKKIKEIENRMYKENQTQIFIEAPYRNEKMMNSLLKTLNNDTKICLACNITLEKESIKTKTVSSWKKEKEFGIQKNNTIFLIYK